MNKRKDDDDTGLKYVMKLTLCSAHQGECPPDCHITYPAPAKCGTCGDTGYVDSFKGGAGACPDCTPAPAAKGCGTMTDFGFDRFVCGESALCLTCAAAKDAEIGTLSRCVSGAWMYAANQGWRDDWKEFIAHPDEFGGGDPEYRDWKSVWEAAVESGKKAQGLLLQRAEAAEARVRKLEEEADQYEADITELDERVRELEETYKACLAVEDPHAELVAQQREIERLRDFRADWVQQKVADVLDGKLDDPRGTKRQAMTHGASEHEADAMLRAEAAEARVRELEEENAEAHRRTDVWRKRAKSENFDLVNDAREARDKALERVRELEKELDEHPKGGVWKPPTTKGD